MKLLIFVLRWDRPPARRTSPRAGHIRHRIRGATLQSSMSAMQIFALRKVTSFAMTR